MADRGSESASKRIRLLPELNEEIDQVPSVEPAESKLPAELLQVIISQLTLRNNIRASLVCKRWLSAAILVRNVDKAPLLMIFPKKGNLYEFCDPAQRESYCLELPELYDSQVCYAKDGWLLLQRLRAQLIFFFSPYTRDLIKLPFKDLKHRSVAFSAAPTSRNCILIMIAGLVSGGVAVSTFRPGESTEWTTINYEMDLPFFADHLNKLFFSNGLFYCFSYSGLFGIYNPDKVTWAVHPMPRPNSSVSFFMAEHHGDIFVIFTKSAKNPRIYKLDLNKKVWSRKKTLGGITLFVNYLSSLARRNLGRVNNMSSLGRTNHARMTDKIYLSKFYSGEHCASYSVDEGRYYPRNKCFNWDHKALYTSIWMEPPKNLSVFL